MKHYKSVKILSNFQIVNQGRTQGGEGFGVKSLPRELDILQTLYYKGMYGA